MGFSQNPQKKSQSPDCKTVTNGNSGDFAVDTYINGETQPNPLKWQRWEKHETNYIINWVKGKGHPTAIGN